MRGRVQNNSDYYEMFCAQVTLSKLDIIFIHYYKPCKIISPFLHLVRWIYKAIPLS